MDRFYGDDLARIHADAFGRLAEAAATEVLWHLGDDAAGARVLDIGCGAGAMAAPLVAAGVKVWGADISPALVEIARQRVPGAEFVLGSMHDLDLPQAEVVCAIGEVINYLADPRAGVATLAAFFRRVAKALKPGGLLLFDAAASGRIAAGARSFTEAEGWAVGTTSEEADGVLTRRITTFRRVERDTWRRALEIHRLALLSPETVLEKLDAAGFDARAGDRYGAFPLPAGLIAYRAVK